LSNDEQAGSRVRSAGVGSSYKAPRRVVPQRGKVSEDDVESENKVVCDVLQDDETGSKYANGVRDVRPEVALIGCSQPLAGGTERLARVASGEDVYGLKGDPVGVRDVAVVRDAGESDIKDFGGASVVLQMPCDIYVEHLHKGQLEPAISGAK
jgi:hypothetical protein